MIATMFDALASRMPTFSKRTRPETYRRAVARVKVEEPAVLKPADPARRAKYRFDFLGFCLAYFAAKVFRDPNRFNVEFAAELQRLALSPIKEKKALAAPRGIGKSTMLQLFCIWCVCYGHRPVFLWVCVNLQKATERLEFVKTQFWKNDLLHADFPELCQPVRDFGNDARSAHPYTWTTSQISFANKCWAICCGIDGPILGMLIEGMRPSMIVIDDPEDTNTVRSRIETQRRRERIEREVCYLGELGGACAVVMITTIRSSDSLSAEYCDPAQRPDWRGQIYRAVEVWPVREDLWQTYMDLVGPAGVTLAKLSSAVRTSGSGLNAETQRRRDAKNGGEVGDGTDHVGHDPAPGAGNDSDLAGENKQSEEPLDHLRNPNSDASLDQGVGNDNMASGRSGSVWASELEAASILNMKADVFKAYDDRRREGLRFLATKWELMNAGAVLLDAERIPLHEIYAEMAMPGGKESVFSELQNDPLANDDIVNLQLTKNELLARQSDTPPGNVPLWAKHVLCTVDMGLHQIWWTVKAWSADFSIRQVILYGCEETNVNAGGRYAQTTLPGLRSLMRREGLEAALKRLDEKFGRGFESVNGNDHLFPLYVGVDIGGTADKESWTDVVYPFCAARYPRWVPMKGVAPWGDREAELAGGLNFSFKEFADCPGVRRMNWNTDFYKTQGHYAWRVPLPTIPGDGSAWAPPAGASFFYREDKAGFAIDQYAFSMTSERFYEETIEGQTAAKSVVRKWIKVKKFNHPFDTDAMNEALSGLAYEALKQLQVKPVPAAALDEGRGSREWRPRGERVVRRY